jgi:hypothetical protein
MPPLTVMGPSSSSLDVSKATIPPSVLSA